MKAITSRGFSILEVLVAGAIGTIVILGIVSVLSSQFSLQKRLLQKNELLDLQNTLRTLIADVDACTCNLGGTGITFDTSLSATFPQTVLLTKPNGIETRCISPKFVVAPLSGLLPGTQTALKIESIHLAEIVPLGSGSQYYAQLRVTPDVTSTAGMAIRAFDIPVFFKADVTTPSSSHVATCNANTGSQTFLVSMSVLNRYLPPGSKNLPPNCAEFFYPSGPPVTDWTLPEAAALHYIVATACHRFCSRACVDTTTCRAINSSPPVLTDKYKIGFATECGPLPADDQVLCSCSK